MSEFCVSIQMESTDFAGRSFYALELSPDCDLVTDSCRLCMARNTTMKQLFDTGTDNIVEMIRFCTGVEFTKVDDLPTQICKTCVDELLTAHRLKTRCLSADEKLRIYLAANRSNVHKTDQGLPCMSNNNGINSNESDGDYQDDTLQHSDGETVNDGTMVIGEVLREQNQHVRLKKESDSKLRESKITKRSLVKKQPDRLSVLSERAELKIRPKLSVQFETKDMTDDEVVHKVDEGSRNKLHCKQWNLQFATKEELDAHRTDVHSYVCEVCDKVFLHRWEHSTHMASHSPRPARSYNTSHKSNFIKHIHDRSGRRKVNQDVGEHNVNNENVSDTKKLCVRNPVQTVNKVVDKPGAINLTSVDRNKDMIKCYPMQTVSQVVDQPTAINVISMGGNEYTFFKCDICHSCFRYLDSWKNHHLLKHGVAVQLQEPSKCNMFRVLEKPSANINVSYTDDDIVLKSKKLSVKISEHKSSTCVESIQGLAPLSIDSIEISDVWHNDDNNVGALHHSDHENEKEDNDYGDVMQNSDIGNANYDVYGDDEKVNNAMMVTDKILGEQQQIVTDNDKSKKQRDSLFPNREISIKRTFTTKKCSPRGPYGNHKASTRRRLKCAACNLQFSTLEEIKAHTKVVHATIIKPTCKVCYLEFAAMKELNAHNKVHRLRQIFICEICGKVSTSFAVQSTHMASHRPPRFHCDHCEYKAQYKSDLVKHMMMHLGMKMYRCKHCPVAFCVSSNLKKHIRRMHERVKPCSCHICGGKFFNQSDVISHLDSHNNAIKRFECDICHLGFVRRADWKKHLLLEHEVAVPPQRRGKRKVNRIVGELSANNMNINDTDDRALESKNLFVKMSVPYNRTNLHKTPTCLESVQGLTPSSINKRRISDVLENDDDNVGALHHSNHEKVKEDDDRGDVMQHSDIENANDDDYGDDEEKVKNAMIVTDKILGGQQQNVIENYKLKKQIGSIFLNRQISIGRTLTTKKCPRGPYGNHKAGTFKKELPMSSAEVTRRRRRKCAACNLQFSTLEEINAHKKVVHVKIIKPTCKVCNLEFAAKKDLNAHKKVHKICGKVSTSFAGPPRYHCDHCEYKAWRKSVFVKHMKIHLGIKMYRCEHCPIAFYLSSNLKKHIRRRHERVKPCSCYICGDKFFNQSELKSHLDSHNKAMKRFECGICHSGFTRRFDCKRHLLRKHGVAVPPKKPGKRKVNRVVGELSAKNMNISDTDDGALEAKKLCVRMSVPYNKINLHKSPTCLESVQGLTPSSIDKRRTSDVLENDDDNVGALHHSNREKVKEDDHGDVMQHSDIENADNDEYGDDDENVKNAMIMTDKILEGQLQNVTDNHKLRKQIDSISLNREITIRSTLTTKKCGPRDPYGNYKAGKSKKELPMSRAEETRRRSRKCAACNLQFSTLEEIKAHNKVVHAKIIKPTCKVCNLEFAAKKELKAHKKVHVMRQTFVCEICGKVSTSFAVQYMHMASHRPPRFHCDHCEHKTCLKADLVNHMRIHSGIKMYRCEHCPFASFFSFNLKNHIRRVHEKVKPYSCHICGGKFFDQCILKRHIENSHNGIKRFECDICHSGFTTRFEWKKHLLRQHGVAVPPQKPGKRKVNRVVEEL